MDIYGGGCIGCNNSSKIDALNRKELEE